ncbi:MAG: GatB/YqeY domain-containing protein [Anaerolineaceae bacterium]|nr:GatB/YqeY domain-containing protein [Anaerolineaceae bacterium]
MTIKESINEKLKEAMKNHDEDGKRVYRMILSSIKFAEKTSGKELEDSEVTQILQKELKIRKESLTEAEKAGREEAAAEAKKDIELIEPFLPKQMTQDELKTIIQTVINEINASSPADMGKVMKAVMPKVKGLAANDLISKTVKELLS